MNKRLFTRWSLVGFVAAAIMMPQSIIADELPIFKIGQRVSITENGVNVRFAPAGMRQATLNAGAQGAILESPARTGRILRGQKDYKWWNVQFRDFAGWVAQDFLRPIGSAPQAPSFIGMPVLDDALTMCPFGYVITGGYVEMYNFANKNIRQIECTSFADSLFTGEDLIAVRVDGGGDQTVGCPAGSFGVGIYLTRMSTTDKHVTSLVCQRGNVGQGNGTDVSLPYNAWGRCPVGSGVTGYHMKNQGGSGDPFVTFDSDETQKRFADPRRGGSASSNYFSFDQGAIIQSLFGASNLSDRVETGLQCLPIAAIAPPPPPNTVRIGGIVLRNSRMPSTATRAPNVGVVVGTKSAITNASGVFGIADIAPGTYQTVIYASNARVEYSFCLVNEGSAVPANCHVSWIAGQTFGITIPAGKYVDVWWNIIPTDTPTPPPSSGAAPSCTLNGITGDSIIQKALNERFGVPWGSQNADYIRVARPWDGGVDCVMTKADGAVPAPYECRTQYLRSAASASYNLSRTQGTWGNLFMREAEKATVTIVPMKNDGTAGASCSLGVITERASITPPPAGPVSRCTTQPWNSTSGGYHDGDGSGVVCKCDYFSASGQSPFSPSPPAQCYPGGAGQQPSPVPAPAGPRVSIQGLIFEKSDAHPRVAGTVTVSSGTSITTRIDNQSYLGCSIKADGACMNGSFVWSNLSQGSRTVTLALPAGFQSAEWSVCYDAVGACHTEASWRAGAVATIEPTYTGYADVWFRLTRTSISPSPVLDPPTVSSTVCNGISLDGLMPGADVGWHGLRNQDIQPGQPKTYCAHIPEAKRIRFTSYDVTDAGCARVEMAGRRLGGASWQQSSGILASTGLTVMGETRPGGTFLDRLPIPAATYEITMTDRGSSSGCRRQDVAWKAD